MPNYCLCNKFPYRRSREASARCCSLITPTFVAAPQKLAFHGSAKATDHKLVSWVSDQVPISIESYNRLTQDAENCGAAINRKPKRQTNTKGARYNILLFKHSYD